MNFDLHNVQVYVMGEKGGVYSLKIEILDLGVYIHGMTIRKSQKSDDWWLQPPKHRLSSGRYAADVEFDTRTELWQAIYQASKDALNEYLRQP